MRTKIRGVAGIYAIPVYTKPTICNSRCIYCPTVEGVPKSYISNEDTERARVFKFNIYKQVSYFSKILENMHIETPTKIEVIVLGGTFSDLAESYRKRFITGIYNALNRKVLDLKEAIEFQATADYRCCVLTVETRPDKITEKECEFLLSLGVSRVELGVQALDDLILKFAKRPYGVDIVKKATKMLKDYGFKVGYHLMLNLPMSTVEKDLYMFTYLLWQPEFSPDHLKIYPTTLLNNREYQSELWKLYKEGKWRLLDVLPTAFVIKEIKKRVPRYVRISRIQRQFDGQDFYGQVKLRILAKSMLRGERAKCNCIRCREVGFIDENFCLEKMEGIEFRDIIYNNGKDVFIEALCQGMLMGYCRLRLTEKVTIRELRVLGNTVPVHQKGKIQGKGLGKELVRIAEDIGKENGYIEIYVTASPGVKSYFYELGFELCKNQLKKKL